MKINTPISVGELVDKITILEIKSVMIKDEDKLKEVENERRQLTMKLAEITDPRLVKRNFELTRIFALKADLHATNLGLWKIEDQIRECERNKDFGDEFVRLARAVYFTNDKRSDVKKSINLLTESGFVEEKSYEDYK